jgi:hypothetical protein
VAIRLVEGMAGTAPMGFPHLEQNRWLPAMAAPQPSQYISIS